MTVDLEHSTGRSHMDGAMADTPRSPSTDVDEHIDLTDEAKSTGEALNASEANRVEPVVSKATKGRRLFSTQVLAWAILPGLALLLALGAGYLKWQDGSARMSQAAVVESVSAATDGTIAMLSYQPDTVDKDLSTARDRMTGDFRNEFTSLINDLVIPGAKQKRISSVATVPAAASVSASGSHAVVLLFVNQTTTIGADPPSDTASAVRVTLDKIHGKWLISQFDPL